MGTRFKSSKILPLRLSIVMKTLHSSTSSSSSITWAVVTSEQIKRKSNGDLGRLEPLSSVDQSQSFGYGRTVNPQAGLYTHDAT